MSSSPKIRAVFDRISNETGVITMSALAAFLRPGTNEIPTDLALMVSYPNPNPTDLALIVS